MAIGGAKGVCPYHSTPSKISNPDCALAEGHTHPYGASPSPPSRVRLVPVRAGCLGQRFRSLAITRKTNVGTELVLAGLSGTTTDRGTTPCRISATNTLVGQLWCPAPSCGMSSHLSENSRRVPQPRSMPSCYASTLLGPSTRFVRFLERDARCLRLSRCRVL